MKNKQGNNTGYTHKFKKNYLLFIQSQLVSNYFNL